MNRKFIVAAVASSMALSLCSCMSAAPEKWRLSGYEGIVFRKAQALYLSNYDIQSYIKPEVIEQINAEYTECACDCLHMFVTTPEDLSEYATSITYEVYYEGEQITPEMIVDVDDTGIDCLAYTSSEEPFLPGEYTLVCKYDDIELASGTANIYVSDQTNESVYDPNYNWWFYNRYDEGTEEINFGLFFSCNVETDNMSFALYDEDGNEITEGLSFDSSMKYYDCCYTADDIQAGTYCFVVYEGDEEIVTGYIEVT